MTAARKRFQAVQDYRVEAVGADGVGDPVCRVGEDLELTDTARRIAAALQLTQDLTLADLENLAASAFSDGSPEGAWAVVSLDRMVAQERDAFYAGWEAAGDPQQPGESVKDHFDAFVVNRV